MIEVEVSERCEHDNFTVQVGSPAVWRISGLPPIEEEAETRFVFHVEGLCECWSYDEEYDANDDEEKD